MTSGGGERPKRMDEAAAIIASTDYMTLATADAAWLLSSVRLAAPVTAIDDVAVAVDAELTADFNRYLLSPRD